MSYATQLLVPTASMWGEVWIYVSDMSKAGGGPPHPHLHRQSGKVGGNARHLDMCHLTDITAPCQLGVNMVWLTYTAMSFLALLHGSFWKGPQNNIDLVGSP